MNCKNIQEYVVHKMIEHLKENDPKSIMLNDILLLEICCTKCGERMDLTDSKYCDYCEYALCEECWDNEICEECDKCSSKVCDDCRDDGIIRMYCCFSHLCCQCYEEQKTTPEKKCETCDNPICSICGEGDRHVCKHCGQMSCGDCCECECHPYVRILKRYKQVKQIKQVKRRGKRGKRGKRKMR